MAILDLFNDVLLLRDHPPATWKEIKLVVMLKKGDQTLIENYRPDVMSRLGIGYEDLSRINPKLIMLSISGFGHNGPESRRPAYAPVIHSEAGLIFRSHQEAASQQTDPHFQDLPLSVADTNAWFTYYYWQDDDRAPDFARTVDIHRKPGYDPCELFLDPQLSFPKLRIAKRLLQKKLGFRMLMDVIPLDAGLVRGSHGACPEGEEHWPVVITQQHNNLPDNQIRSTDVYNVIRAQVLGEKFRK